MCLLFTNSAITLFFAFKYALYLPIFAFRFCNSFSSSSFPDGFTDTVSTFFSEPQRLWDHSYMASRISVRLVKKSWTPKGMTYDKYMDEFPGDVDEAYDILRANFNYEYTERPLLQAGELFTVTGENKEDTFDKNQESIIIFHPMYSNADDTYFAVPSVTALAMRNVHKSYNIFLYHMPQLNFHQFLIILRVLFGLETRYENMAEVICSFILDGVREKHWLPSKLHFVGFSYSGNLTGYVARFVKHATKTKISSILCLDPYSAQYNEHLMHVNKHDADVVHILHSSSYVQGTRERVATADFVFNGGLVLPECIDFDIIMKRILDFQPLHDPFSCSHTRISQRFWYLILYPSKFKARQCETWPMFQLCECEERQHTFISFPIVSRDAHGTFYLITTNHGPYGLGDEGSHCSKKAKDITEQ